MGKDFELQKTHNVLLKSPRVVLQIKTLSQQIGLGSQLKEWYQDATSIPYSHSLIEFTPKTVDSIKILHKKRFSSITFFYRNRNKVLDDERTIRLYTYNISNIFPKTSRTIHPPLSKKVHSVPQRILSKLATRRDTGSAKSRGKKTSKKISVFTRRKTSLQKG